MRGWFRHGSVRHPVSLRWLGTDKNYSYVACTVLVDRKFLHIYTLDNHTRCVKLFLVSNQNAAGRDMRITYAKMMLATSTNQPTPSIASALAGPCETTAFRLIYKKASSCLASCMR